MPRRRTEEQTAYVQSSVLSASAKLYLEKGFSHTTVKDISAASGITVNRIMKMMKSKKNILAQLVEFVLESQFSAAKGFLAGCEYDPILFYAAETAFLVYRMPEEHIQEAIQFVSRFDYPQLARSTIQTMLERPEQTMTGG